MAPSIPLVRFAHVAHFCDQLERIGSPVRRRLCEARLPSLGLEDPELLASAVLIYDFVERSRLAEGFTDIGWVTGVSTSPEAVGALGESFLPGSDFVTLHECLLHSFDQASRESRQISLWLERRGPWVDVCYEPSLGAQHRGFLMAEQYMFGLLTMLIRTAVGADWRPPALLFRSQAPTGLESVPELEGVLVQTGAPRTALRLPGELLRVERSCAPFAPGAKTLVRPGVPGSAGAQQKADFTSSLSAALSSYLPGGGPSIDLAARLCNTSVRSLQRSLSDSGTSYSRLIDGIRLRRAQRMLVRSDVKLSEIAEELGYADHAHFTRAFRRWTGLTPSAFRASGRP